MAPSRTRPRRGREPGASPQRGEAGRGAARCARWSPQPSMRLRRTQTGMNIGSSWKGVARPDPPAGGGVGQPGCPIPLRKGQARLHPPAGGGVGQPGCPHPPACGPGPPTPFHRAGAWDNPVPPCSRQARRRVSTRGDTAVPRRDGQLRPAQARGPSPLACGGSCIVYGAEGRRTGRGETGEGEKRGYHAD